MDATIHQSVDRFSGITNVDEPTRLFPVVVDRMHYVYPLQQANNVEIDNTYGISSRSGYTSVKTGTDIHSLWSDDKVCLYADGATLYELGTGYGLVAIRADLFTGARISYAPFNDRIYYTNEHQIGYVKGSADHYIPDPALEFKLPLPAGQFIEVFMGCLYVARDNVLYIGDPLCDYYDTRYGFRIFNKRMTMLRAVDDGLYVSDDRIWFVKGKGSDEFERDEVYPVRAIPHTDVKVAGKYIDDGMAGNVALWTGENGVCLGNNSGVVINLTEARYTFTPRGKGAGFVRENANVRHYVNSIY